MNDCNKCDGDNYILLGCCSGHECGCMGQPVQMTNCKLCNPKGDADLPENENFREYAEHVEYIGVELDNS